MGSLDDSKAQIISAIERAQDTDPDTAAELLIGAYKHAKSSAEVFDKLAKDARAVMADLIEETGVTDWKTESGSTRLTKPSVSVRYDAKALDALAASNTKHKRLLWPHRKETQRAGSIMVR
jgi:hypothetical protein